MHRAEALETLRREYQSDYQKEVTASRSIVSHGILALHGADGTIALDDKDSFVSLGSARKRFVEALTTAVRPLLENYSKELEREAATLGLHGKAEGGGDLLMESLHEALRQLQQVDGPSQPGGDREALRRRAADVA